MVLWLRRDLRSLAQHWRPLGKCNRASHCSACKHTCRRCRRRWYRHGQCCSNYLTGSLCYVQLVCMKDVCAVYLCIWVFTYSRVHISFWATGCIYVMACSCVVLFWLQLAIEAIAHNWLGGSTLFLYGCEALWLMTTPYIDSHKFMMSLCNATCKSL